MNLLKIVNSDLSTYGFINVATIKSIIYADKFTTIKYGTDDSVDVAEDVDRVAEYLESDQPIFLTVYNPKSQNLSQFFGK
jgi:hypothetical protein